MPTGITLGKAIKVFQKELGCDGEDESAREELIDAVQSGIEFMLLNGGGNILREWDVLVKEGIFTLPRDLETPIKYRFGDAVNSDFGTVYSGFHPYSSRSISQVTSDYSEWGTAQVNIHPNKSPVQYQPPKKGVRLVATTRDKKDVGKKIMVQGKLRGMEVAPMHNGYKTAGELLTIYLEKDKKKKYGAWMFDEITGVVKDPTCSYTMLSGVDLCCDPLSFYFLSHYHPDDEVPQYTQLRFHTNSMWSRCCPFKLFILGKIASNIRYTRDEDILPITSTGMLRLLAKRARYDDTGDFQEAAIVEARIQRMIKVQVAYQQAAKRGLSFGLKASGFTLTNV